MFYWDELLARRIAHGWDHGGYLNGVAEVGIRPGLPCMAIEPIVANCLKCL